MRPSSVQRRRLLAEQEPVPRSSEVEKAEEKPQQEPANIPARPSDSKPQGDTTELQGASPEVEKVRRTIKAIEKLQDAAVGCEAARFVLAQEYSDFSLAKKLEIIKQELINVISKAREHTMRSSAKSPEAESEVSKWLKL